ncbi:MAG: nuclear transport factor 2 family protein [Sphingomicrobium sp.]
MSDHVHAIQNLKAQYCQTIDRAAGDADGVRDAFVALFLTDVAADYGHGTMVGAAQLSDFLCSAIAQSSEWAMHMIHTPLINVEGDRATGQWTVMTHLKRRETGQVDVVLGRYVDGFRLTAEGWRIASVTFSRLV